MINKKRVRLWLIILIFNFCTAAFGGGISTTDSTIEMGLLPAGGTYSMVGNLGRPFSVDYNGKQTVVMKLVVEKPSKQSREYEPIPNASWITIIKNSFSPAPGEVSQTDIIVKIPDDNKLVGKKYYAYIYPQLFGEADYKGTGTGIALGVGLLCKLQFEIASPRLGGARNDGVENEWMVLIEPERIFAKNNESFKLKVKNPTHLQMKLKIKSVYPLTAGIRPQEGYLIPQDSEWLKVQQKKYLSLFLQDYVIQPVSEVEIPCLVKMPSNVTAGNYFFLIKAEISRKRGTKAIRYVKIYAEH